MLTKNSNSITTGSLTSPLYNHKLKLKFEISSDRFDLRVGYI